MKKLPLYRVVLSKLSTSLCFVMLVTWVSVSHSANYSGTVVDMIGNPVNNAVVRLQGTAYSASTDSTGYFKINVNHDIFSKHITAWKNGYYIGGIPLNSEEVNYTILLRPIPRGDNTAYLWQPSLKALRDGDTDRIKPCRHCHEELSEQWHKSTHASSATNPLFLTFFSESSIDGRKGTGSSYKTDYPNSNGNCATCHVPAMALKNPFAADPREARGIESEGVFCDLCHKIDDAQIDKIGGRPGILSFKFNRPPQGQQLFLGQYDDVFPGEDSYHPLYKESRICAPCHNGKFWNVLVYPEFEEWSESSYAQRNIHCQDCHMKEDDAIIRFAPDNEGGLARGPKTIPSHSFNGIQDRAFMSQAIEVESQVELKESDLIVTTAIKNVNAGHHYPTGNPMRHMLLLVEAREEDGSILPLIFGERVPSWGGIGPAEQGNYAGLPGKGFAKVLKDVSSYPDGRGQRHFHPEYPAPHWRPTIIESDNRIPANGTDTSQYIFSIPTEFRGTISVLIRLVFRRTYKNWSDGKGITLNDLELTRKSLKIER